MAEPGALRSGADRRTPGDWASCHEHCEASLESNPGNNKARVLRSAADRQLGRAATSDLSDLLETDPLDHWARYESGDIEGFFAKSRNDAQTILDIAYDYADAGMLDEAIELIERHHDREVGPSATPNPLAESSLTRYALAWLRDQNGPGCGDGDLEQARNVAPDFLFPSRLHDQIVLEWSVAHGGEDRNASYGLGNYYYDRGRHDDAIAAWESARDADPKFATVCRNLGVAHWNVRRDRERARSAYQQAVRNDPHDARIWYEYDQLRKKLGDPLDERLADLLARGELADQRDDCTVELATLYNDTAQPAAALDLLSQRRFHPWEGGEGLVLKQYTRAHLLLGQDHLERGAPGDALEHFELAMRPPRNLGEAYHLLQAKADVNYWIGKALRSLGREREAITHFEASAAEENDFQAMAVTQHSELSYYRGLSLLELARLRDAEALFLDLRSFAANLLVEKAEIDYFATSLPLLLVFDDDLDETQQQLAVMLSELADRGMERHAAAAERLRQSGAASQSGIGDPPQEAVL